MIAVLLGLCVPAYAVGEADPIAREEDEVETFVITARRSEEDPHEVPLAVSSLSRSEILDAGGGDIHALAARITNFTMAPAQGRQSERPIIRGQSNVAGEPNAAFYIDGFYVSNRTVIGATLTTALERLEVVRGPQTSLYGRAAFAGAVNYVTPDAGGPFHAGGFARVATTGDDFIGERNIAAWAGGDLITDRLGFYLHVANNHLDGEWRNEFSGLGPDATYPGAPTRADHSLLGEENTGNVFAKLEADPWQGVHLTASALFTNADDGHYPFVFFGRDTLNCRLPVGGTTTENSPGYICGEIDMGAGASVANLPDIEDGLTFFTGSSGPGTDPGNDRDSLRFMARADIDINDWQLSLQGSHAEDDHLFAEDSDRTGARVSAVVIDKHAEDQTLEARLISPSDRALRGTLGAFWFHQEFDDRRRVLFSGFRPRATIDEVRNQALFGSMEFDLTPRLTATAEARYAWDEITVAAGAASETFESFTPRFTLRYDVNDHWMVYGLVANGSKPGGFNAIYFDNDTHEDERVAALASGRAFIAEERAWTYEAGAKYRSPDRALEFELSGFLIDWTDQQMTTTVDILQEDLSIESQPILVNLAASQVWGIDLAVSGSIAPGWDWTLNYGLAISEITRANDPEEAALSGYDDPLLLNGGNISGQELPKAPRHSLFGTLTYRDRLTHNIDWFASGEALYESHRWAQVHNLLHTGDRTNVNLRVGLETDRWTLSVFGENIFDDDTPLNIQRYRDFSNGYGPSGRTGVGDNPLWRGFSATPQRAARVGAALTIRFH